MENVKPSSLEVVDVSVSLIDTNPSNPNEMDDKSYSTLVDKIKEAGFIIPLTLHKKPDGRYMLINGEHRFRAGRELNYEYLPSVILSDERLNDPDYLDLVNIQINEIRGRLSISKFMPIYQRVVDRFGKDQAQHAMGITSDDVYKKMIRKIGKMVSKNVPDSVAADIQKTLEKVERPDQFGKAIAKIFADQAREQESNCIIIKHGSKDHMVIKASQDLFMCMNQLAIACKASGKDIDSVMLDFLKPVVAKMNDEVPDISIEI